MYVLQILHLEMRCAAAVAYSADASSSDTGGQRKFPAEWKRRLNVSLSGAIPGRCGLDVVVDARSVARFLDFACDNVDINAINRSFPFAGTSVCWNGWWECSLC